MAAWTEPPRLLTDAEAREIEQGVQSGIRGPVLDKWVRQLLADRARRVEMDQARQAERRRRLGKRYTLSPGMARGA